MLAGLWLGSCQKGQAQISKGNQILLNQGLQLQGLVSYDDFFNLSTYSNANYISVNFGFTSNPLLLGPAPGFLWSRWVGDQTQMPPLNGEGPYTNQLFSLQLTDEPNLNDDTIRSNSVNWFNSVQTNYPNTILYLNSYGGQVSDATLGDFITRAKPDMLSFDTYPFLADYTTGVPNTWPYSTWLSEMRRYRQWGVSANLPVAVYMQAFHSVEDYDQRIYRVPSPSELRFNIFAALAFNAKVLIDFTYNSGATALFNILPNGYSGDTYTNALYAEKTDANRRALNLGKSLVCLKPISDLHNPNDANPPPGPASGNVNFPDGTTTSILILKGNPNTTTNTSEPIGFQDDPPSSQTKFSWWEFTKNDPYLTGWVVTNKGVNNGGSPGQVIISWFKPLDEKLDGTNYSNEIYFMVVNALTATNGTAADCLQEIMLNFIAAVPSAVVMLDPETGLLHTNTMPVIPGSGGRRQLVLDLNGGDAALFKFSDGAPFVGHIPPAPARLGVTLQAGVPILNISQLSPGARYQLQSTPALGSSNWTTLTALLLTNSSTQFRDTGSTNGGYYRVVGIP